MFTLTDDDLRPEEYVVWKASLDDRFGCRVISDERTPYAGRLNMREFITGELLVDEPVTIAYGARFGPDLTDLDSWQRRCEDIADRFIAENPPPDPWKIGPDPWASSGE